MSLVATNATAADRPPWQGLEYSGDNLAPIGNGFDLTDRDLNMILDQINIAEAHTATRTASEPCSTLIGPGPNQLPEEDNTELNPLGLRTISGECNNLLPGQSLYGATDQAFPRLAPADFRAPYLVSTPGPPIADPQPREISNLIVDQTDFNPAAVEAAGNPPVAVPTGVEQSILNTAPDEGLSAPFNDMLTFFGQFFDHGLDFKETSGSTETIMVPLDPSDPLYDPAPFAPNFMAVTRTIKDSNGDALNRTSPFVDQNQTYASHPSKTVFLREYAPSAGPGSAPVTSGRLIEGASGGMATWGEMKTQAADVLGIQLVDLDIHDVPLLVTDPYGNFVPGINGFPQIMLDGGGTLEGDPTANGNTGVLVPANALRTNHDFLADIAHQANPAPGIAPDADAVITAGALADPMYVPNPGGTVYDDEMLDAHFMAGDGRVNENIALTSVHHIFHSEHNRLVAYIDDAVQTRPAISTLDWETTAGDAGWDYGTRLFAAAKMVTEMEYQHLVFEEFGRTIQPDINVFFGYDPTIDSAISAEFAHATYRFGHSMLNTDVLRFEADGTPDNITLFDAFLNPPAWLDGTYANADEAAGAVFRGGVTGDGQEIDEFVVDGLRNQLLGLPLDLATINMVRARENGIPRMNDARRAFYAAMNSEPSLAPYGSWIDFQFHLKNESSIVNFVAAYGIHTDLAAAGSDLDARRAAAQDLVDMVDQDAIDFMFGMGAYANVADRSVTGLEDVDLWVGGLAEAKAPFGGFLGTSHNYVFEEQMERLQNGDRFYYLHRFGGEDILDALEGNSFSELIMRNTDVEGLPAVVFSKPTYNFDVTVIDSALPAVTDDPATGYDESNLPDAGLIRLADGTLWYPGGEHANWNGSANNDRIRSGLGDDTVRGNDGDDRIESGAGNDEVVGGLGNDILTDLQGVDGIKGGPGHDYIHGGPGVGDLLQGGHGDDFMVGGNDGVEHLAAEGNDLIIAGGGFDVVLGGGGDDWIEGGNDTDELWGDNAQPAFDDPIGDNDVIAAGPGDDAPAGEGGMDIFIADTGFDDLEGGQGYDFFTHYGDPNPGYTDLDIGELTPETEQPFADRFNLTEGLSGWIHDDVLIGDHNNLDFGDNILEAEHIALIPGIEGILPTGATEFSDGNLIMGGPGSDLIEARGKDDIVDGDAYLLVELEYAGNRYMGLDELEPMAATGALNASEVSIVREVIHGEGQEGDVDTAVFRGPIADYDISATPDGIVVDHVRGDGEFIPAGPLDEPSDLDDGADLLRNIELFQFADVTIASPDAIFLCNGAVVTVNLNLGETPTAGDDVILGTPGDDTIDGLGGHDFICGIAGDDTLFGSDGNDVILGGTGMDTINGGIDGDQLYGGPDDDTLNGGDQPDYIDGGAGADILRGDGDNDILLGQSGDDTLEGGAGFDEIYGFGGDDTLYGEGPGVLTGDADYLWGGPDTDTFHGNGGDDWLEGGDEGEVMNGDAGNDIILGHGGADTLNGGSGLDYLWGGLGVDTYNGGDDRDTLDGNDGGEDAGEVMNGGGGQDDILGHGGADTLNGDAGSDYLWGGTGVDTYNGGADADYLDGNDGGEDAGEVMNGDGGADQVIGHGGDDTLSGGDDDDYLWGGDGADQLDGDAGVADICEDPQGGTFGPTCEVTLP